MYSFFNLSIVYIWRCRMRQIGKSSVEQTARKNSQQTVKTPTRVITRIYCLSNRNSSLLSLENSFKSNPLGQQLQKYDHGRVWFFYLIHPVSTHRSIDHQQSRLSVSDAQSMSCINSLLILALTTLGPRDNLQSLLARYFRQLIEELT